MAQMTDALGEEKGDPSSSRHEEGSKGAESVLAVCGKYMCHQLCCEREEWLDAPAENQEISLSAQVVLRAIIGS